MTLDVVHLRIAWAVLPGSTFGLESRSLHEPLPVHVTTHTRPRWHGYFRVSPLTTHNRRDASPPPACFRNPVLQSRSGEDYETENAAAELTNRDFDWAIATRYQSQSLTRRGDWMSVQISARGSGALSFLR